MSKTESKKIALTLFEVFKHLETDRKICIIVFASDDKRHTAITNEYDPIKLMKDLNSVAHGIDIYKKQQNN